MSNFETISLVTGGHPGTAAQVKSAVTPDTYATLTATGYLSDLDQIVNPDDVWFVRYLDGVSGAAIQQFKVAADGVTLIPMTTNLVGQFANGGGSATVTITDARITAGMGANVTIDSSANAVTVEKANPGAGTIVVLLSGDPGAGTLLNYQAFSLV